jgi:glycerol uptake facilitator protein
MSEHFVNEFLGVTTLILLGNGVVANVLLKNSKGQGSGWLVITLAWGIAVFCGVLVSKGGSLNPAGSIAAYLTGDHRDFAALMASISGQMLGAMFGAFLAYLVYKLQFDQHDNADEVLACFATGPAIRNPFWNFVAEFIATFALVFIAKHISVTLEFGSLQAIPLLFLILGLGLSLGGPTGYALNPARDLGPRIVHALLPLKNKRDSDWSYSWIPVIAPICGAIAASLAFNWL